MLLIMKQSTSAVSRRVQMGLDPEAGAVRLSFVHYTSTVDMTKLIAALYETLKR
jgi:selenocysteine lyase/cysteine desulfurase